MNSKRDFSLKQSTDGKTSLVVVGLFLIDPLKIASTLSDFHCLMKAGKVGRNVGESKKKNYIVYCFALHLWHSVVHLIKNVY